MNNFSTTGYKDDSPDRNNSHNIIPGNLITMKGVSKPLMLVPIIGGQPQYDKRYLANPGDDDVEFGSEVEGVLELPYAQIGGGGFLNPDIFKNISGISQNQFTRDNTGVLPGTSYMENSNPYMNTSQNQTSVPQPLGTLNIAPPQTSVPQPGAFIPQQAPPQVQDGISDQRINEWNSQARTFELGNNAQVTTDPNLLQQMEAQMVKNKQSEQQKKPFIGAINPYGGWNMENSATALGAFAQDKNALGTVASAGKLLLSGARNFMSGSAAMKNYRESEEDYNDKMQEAERTQGWHWLQKGGKIGKLMTGNFIEGDEDHKNPNTEVEKGEYLQTPDGSTMEVIGKRHSDGGELLNMPGGTKVVSDYIKIGAKLASYFKKEFDLNVKSSNTFATVLDKYKKKIGLTELLDEETKLMDKISAQDEVKFEGTRELNLQVLSEKVNELQAEKEEMESTFQNFTNVVFSKQEESKEPGENNFEKQMGGDVEQQQAVDPNDQPVPQQPDNQIQELITQYAQITGQDPQQIVEQLQQLPEDQLEQAIQQMVSEVQGQQQPVQQEAGMEQQVEAVNAEMRNGGNILYAQLGDRTPRKDFDTYRGQYQWDANYEYGNIEEEAKAIVPFLQRNGISYNPEDLKTQAGMDKLAGLAQQAFRTNFQGVSNHYSSKVVPTQQGVQTALDNGLVTEADLKGLGVKINKGKVLRGSKGIAPSPESENKIQQLIVERGQKNPEAFSKYVDNNFVDNKWYFRNPNIRTVEFDTQQEIDDYIKTNKFNMVEDVKGNKIYDTDKQGLYFNPVLKGTPPVTATEPDSTSNPDPKAGINAMGNRDRNWDNGLPMLTPDQSNLAPNYIPTSMRQVGHVQANNIAISPEETIRELNRQYVTASNLASETNPYTSGAMQANLQAQTNNATNQAYGQAALANAQDERNVANINEERIQVRDNANMNAMGQYEKEAITGLDNYIQSWRNFIDKKNLENVNNWNLENQRQAFNAVNDNYKIGAMGWYQTDEEPTIYYNGMNGLPPQANQRIKESSETSRTNPDGSKSKKKSEVTTNPGRRQKGGLLSNDIKKWLK